MNVATATLESLLANLWREPRGDIAAILPRDEESLLHFYPRLCEYVTNAPRARNGTIDPAAVIRGEIVSMAEGSVIEAGAIVHQSCRLILGPRSIVRSNAVLRDEVVVGPDSMIGVNCEVVRSVILGPASYAAHFVFLADSIVGARVNVSGGVLVANTNLHEGSEISIRTSEGKLPTGRTHLGALIGDGVRLGAGSTICPGTIIEPDLELPPAVVLLGVVDRSRRARLMRDFIQRWDGHS